MASKEALLAADEIILFDRECSIDEHTDVGELWELVGRLVRAVHPRFAQWQPGRYDNPDTDRVDPEVSP